MACHYVDNQKKEKAGLNASSSKLKFIPVAVPFIRSSNLVGFTVTSGHTSVACCFKGCYTLDLHEAV